MRSQGKAERPVGALEPFFREDLNCRRFPLAEKCLPLREREERASVQRTLSSQQKLITSFSRAARLTNCICKFERPASAVSGGVQ